MKPNHSDEHNKNKETIAEKLAGKANDLFGHDDETPTPNAGPSKEEELLGKPLHLPPDGNPPHRK